MTRFFNDLLQDPFALVVPVLWLVGTLLAGLLLRKLLFRTVRGWAASTGSHLDVLMTESLQGPLVLWSLILGLHLATQNSELPRRYLLYIPPTLTVLWILSLTIAMSGLAGNAVRFYGSRVTGAKEVTSLTQKLTQLLVVALGLVWLLKVVFDISLTPILTTLGVGGIAVALALQDTLSNLFAGFYVSISGLVRIGDYIKLNTGEEGYVTDITWRCTTMRGRSNNLVVIPNNKLGQAIYTNYFLPDRRVIVTIQVGVAYDSDIDRVEAILTDETALSAATIPGLLADPPAKIFFTPGPADFALIYQINFSVSEFTDQFLAQSELRKRVFKRLCREGINIPYQSGLAKSELKNPA